MPGVLDPNLPVPEQDDESSGTPTAAAGSDFIGEAKHFIRNPLGIVGLFIVLVYSVATIVAGVLMSNSECVPEYHWLLLFITLFPVLILATFTYLVVNHHTKLYAPSDYGAGEFLLLFRQHLDDIDSALQQGDQAGLERVGAAAKPELRKKVAAAKQLVDEKIAQRLLRR